MNGSRWSNDSSFLHCFLLPTRQSSSCTETYHPSRKLSKLDKPDMQDIAGELEKSSCDVFLWTHSHGRVKSGQLARTYIHQLCEDTGCRPEYLPEAMNDRERWREKVRDIRDDNTMRWDDEEFFTKPLLFFIFQM